MIEIIVETDEFSRTATDGVHFRKDATQIRLEHVKRDVIVGVRNDLQIVKAKKEKMIKRVISVHESMTLSIVSPPERAILFS